MSFCDNGESQNNSYQYQDPLGAGGSSAGTGAIPLRSNIFNYLGANQSQLTNAGQTSASALQSAAANPGFGAAQENASKTAAGDYLAGSPQLNSALAHQQSQTLSDAANQDARIKSQYAKNGLQFSTGNEQAQESNNAAANATAANTSAQTYLQNYLSERGNQANAGSQLAQSYAPQLQYLSGVSGALTQPLGQEGNLLSSLSGGGQYLNSGSSGVSSPGIGEDISAGIGSL